ncbi:Yippee/Mis18 [Chytridium lagenaria]|nr:Yippee/Mis18 [Chytridium lagenaria]
MGIVHKRFLDDIHPTDKVLGCTECKTHLSTQNEILSKQFQGAKGKAYLCHKVFNIIEGRPEDRTMTTGLHTVRDIFCLCCHNVVGWKYDKAFEESQRYKEGKFILEKASFREL